MQIIIPMAGFGERFRKAGYTAPKTLLEVGGKPIFHHIIDLFPGESNFLFIINQEDGATFQIESKIRSILPSAKVVSIPSHKKGPIWTLLQAEQEIAEDLETVVNYCDFSCVWDWRHFRRFVQEQRLDGAIPSYRGFHPHTIYSNYYAYLRCNQQGLVTAIQEKTPFTDNPREEWASSGTYYFKTGSLLKQSLHQAIDQNLVTNGEFYVSLAYQPLLEQKARISPYPLQHFMQWGTPQDFEDFLYWFDRLPRKREPLPSPPLKGTLLLPMAGLGSRFAGHPSGLPKPLIPIDGLPMVVRAAADLPAMEQQTFVLRKEHLSCIPSIQSHFPQAHFTLLDQPTEGQASTCLLGAPSPEEPLLIGACDNGMIFNKEQWKSSLENPAIDIVVFGARSYPGAIRNPEAYGWLQLDQTGKVQAISVKKPFGDLKNDPVITGAFYFKKGKYFLDATHEMIRQERRVKGEFYVDEALRVALERGLSIQCVDVDAYLCWGTPNDLNTFEYWSSCFKCWP